MENGTGDSPSSNNGASLAMIMPPPLKVENGGSEVAAELENPSSVRNLKDLLNFTTKMTADVPTENNRAADMALAEEVSNTWFDLLVDQTPALGRNGPAS